TPPQFKQPIQAKSNLHADFYVDYSHGIRAIGPTALVNGQQMNTVDLYQHPTLSALVSNEGPVRVPRYPSIIIPQVNVPTQKLAINNQVLFAPTQPGGVSDLGDQELSRVSGNAWPINWSARGPR